MVGRGRPSSGNIYGAGSPCCRCRAKAARRRRARIAKSKNSRKRGAHLDLLISIFDTMHQDFDALEAAALSAAALAAKKLHLEADGFVASASAKSFEDIRAARVS